ncbi:hypothetical protein CYY_005133 [Polysphondylium violaceum]|uniref:Uncharacterized protein n=1 Tax=Polysphondylium violaceum TaxID=133409 RepID=A0A8J4PS79_9MYCE|nr:hypothetical protein CYY_005133 [Polysphondylium violaceum]
MSGNSSNNMNSNSSWFKLILKNKILRRKIYGIVWRDYIGQCDEFQKIPYDMFNYPLSLILRQRNLSLLKYRFKMYKDMVHLRLSPSSTNRFYEFPLSFCFIDLCQWDSFPIDFFTEIYYELLDIDWSSLLTSTTVNTLFNHSNHGIFKFLCYKFATIIDKIDFKELIKTKSIEIFAYFPKYSAQQQTEAINYILLDNSYSCYDSIISKLDGQHLFTKDHFLIAIENSRWVYVKEYINRHQLFAYEYTNDDKQQDTWDIKIIQPTQSLNQDKEYLKSIINASFKSNSLEFVQYFYVHYTELFKSALKDYSLNIDPIFKNVNVLKYIKSLDSTLKLNAQLLWNYSSKHGDMELLKFLYENKYPFQDQGMPYYATLSKQVVGFLLENNIISRFVTNRYDSELFKVNGMINYDFYTDIAHAVQNNDFNSYKAMSMKFKDILPSDRFFFWKIISEAIGISSYDIFQQVFMLDPGDKLLFSSLTAYLGWSYGGIDPKAFQTICSLTKRLPKTDDARKATYQSVDLAERLKDPTFQITFIHDYYVNVLQIKTFYFDNLKNAYSFFYKDLLEKSHATPYVIDHLLHRGLLESNQVTQDIKVGLLVEIIRRAIHQSQYRVLAYLYHTNCYEFHNEPRVRKLYSKLSNRNKQVEWLRNFTNNRNDPHQPAAILYLQTLQHGFSQYGDVIDHTFTDINFNQLSSTLDYA